VGAIIDHLLVFIALFDDVVYTAFGFVTGVSVVLSIVGLFYDLFSARRWWENL